jgi:hypothetical protein
MTASDIVAEHANAEGEGRESITTRDNLAKIYLQFVRHRKSPYYVATAAEYQEAIAKVKSGQPCVLYNDNLPDLEAGLEKVKKDYQYVYGGNALTLDIQLGNLKLCWDEHALLRLAPFVTDLMNALSRSYSLAALTIEEATSLSVPTAPKEATTIRFAEGPSSSESLDDMSGMSMSHADRFRSVTSVVNAATKISKLAAKKNPRRPPKGAVVGLVILVKLDSISLQLMRSKILAGKSATYKPMAQARKTTEWDNRLKLEMAYSVELAGVCTDVIIDGKGRPS